MNNNEIPWLVDTYTLDLSVTYGEPMRNYRTPEDFDNAVKLLQDTFNRLIGEGENALSLNVTSVSVAPRPSPQEAEKQLNETLNLHNELSLSRTRKFLRNLLGFCSNKF